MEGRSRPAPKLQSSAQVFLVLFSCTSQRASSLFATSQVGGRGEYREQVLDLEQVLVRESWPWGKTPSTSTLPVWADSGRTASTSAPLQPAEDANSGLAAGWAVVGRGLKPWTPEWSELNELDRTLEQAEQEMAQEPGQHPAAQNESDAKHELFEARRTQAKAQWAKDKLQAEVEAKRRELSKFIEAEHAEQQATKQQELRKASDTQQATAQAAEQAASDAQALQAAKAEAAQQARAAQAAQARMQEFQAQVGAKQREVRSAAAKEKDAQDELAIKQYELQEVSASLPAKLQAAERAALGVKTLQEARAQAAEQVRAAQEAARVDAESHEHELVERREKLLAQVVAKQGELNEAREAELAAEQAAERADRDVQSMQSAQARAVEQALAAQAQAETEAKQRELQVLERDQSLEAELESKRRELQQATEALQATQATEALHFKQAAEALLAGTRAAEQARAPQASDTVPDPTQPGCYVRIPSGCPRLRARSWEWRKDSWAEQQGLDMERCQRRKGVWDKYCESTDTQMTFVTNATHSE